ncbi:hypothetical protein E4T56_gene12513 [Termitomyces sp. T112]|nr:hypothetical protein E4T56_gene12513 [Termitomyces sp. T112]
MEGLPAVGGGAQQEAVETQVDGRASRASPLFSYLKHATGTSFKFLRALTFNHRGFSMLAGEGFDNSIDGMRGGALMGKGGSGCSTEGEGGAAVKVGHLGASGNRAGIGGAGFGGASSTAGGTTYRGGGGVAGGIGGWFIVGGARGSRAEGGLVGQRGCLRPCGGPLLSAGAPSSPGWCLCGTGVNPRWVDADVCGSPSGASAGDGKNGEVAGRALVAQCGGPRVVVGGGSGCGGGLARVGGVRFR